MTAQLTINGKKYDFPVDLKNIPLVEFLRDHLQLTGTKFGCGIGQCGACTVHIGGTAERACQTSIGEIEGRPITTIEGLAPPGGLHPLQTAWIDEQVPQCGYCQPGQIMTAAAFLAENPKPVDQDIREAMDGNLCRCGTYQKIRAAIRRAAEGAGK